MLNDLTEAMKALDGKKMGLICFWTFSGLCMMVQTFLVPTFMDKNFNGCLRNTLAACFAFAKRI